MRAHLRTTTALAVTAASLVALSTAPSGAAPGPERARASAGATRVLTVGDSLTQSHAGEYSWRRFAWREWQRQGTRVDLVGPYRAPHVEPGGAGPAAYADPAFDQDHAAIWGDSLLPGLSRHDRDALIRAHVPDVVVLAMGTNDLTWLQAPPAQVRDAVAAWIVGARQARPGVDVVVAEVPAPRSGAVTTYNALLATLASQLDSPGQRVAVARTSAGFVPATSATSGGDTYDPNHPDTSGEVKYAAAVVDALARVGVGRPHLRPLVTPAEGQRVAPTLSLAGRSRAVAARWSRPPGSRGTDVWVRQVGGPWRTVVTDLPGTGTEVTGLTSCRTYDVRVAARRGWTRAASDRWTTRRVKVGGPVAKVAKVKARRASSRTLRLSWRKDAEACSYRVRVSHRTKAGRAVVRTSTVSAAKARTKVARLPRGVKVKVRVRAVGVRGQGPWSRAVRR